MARKKEDWGDEVGSAAWARVVAPAPGDLRIVQALVNTVDLVTGVDELTSPRVVADWLARWRLATPDAAISEEDFQRALDVRDGLRTMVGANRGGSTDAAALAKLDRAVFTVALRVRFDAGGATRYEPMGNGFEGALGRLVQLVASARAEDLWRRLKLCADPGCRRAFFDGSQNRVGKWCSMSRCGGRFKSRVFRRRNPRYH